MSIVSQVLHLEQLLTTGGGWQDQCGGLYGGVKVSRSYKGLPVKIYTEQLDLSEELFDKLERHLLLVYTGVTRLARNLLQVCISHLNDPLYLLTPCAQRYSRLFRGYVCCGHA